MSMKNAKNIQQPTGMLTRMGVALSMFCVVAGGLSLYTFFGQSSKKQDLSSQDITGNSTQVSNTNPASSHSSQLSSSLLFTQNTQNPLNISSIPTIFNTPNIQNISNTPYTSHVIEKVVSSSQVWRPVQERVRDTVMQVFAQVVESDILQPYKTPAQSGGAGSGFFINEDGYFLTNAHVVDQAKTIWIQVPSLGKRIIDVELVGISHDRDIALLKVSEEGIEIIRKELGTIPYLKLGDSDLLRRSDEALALGYPLGQQSLKSTSGIVSGREHHLIQTSAPLNPGSSGGPLLNMRGEVIGINEAGVTSAQNVGYAIPINDVKVALADMYTVPLLRKPFLGVLFNNGSEWLTEYLGNPAPGGCYVVEVVEGSTLQRAGIRSGDMIYGINGHIVDMFGEMAVPWGEDKISIVDYVGRLSVGDQINLLAYRKGAKKELSARFEHAQMPAIHKIYPGYEPIDYEVFGGMVVTELTLNHVQLMANQAPGLVKYTEFKNQSKPVLVVTHLFPSSQIYRTRTVAVGSTINEVNGIRVHTLADLRTSLLKGSTGKFLTLRISDNVARASDNILVVLPYEKVLSEEPRLARDYRYALSDTYQEIVTATKIRLAASKMPKGAGILAEAA